MPGRFCPASFSPFAFQAPTKNLEFPNKETGALAHTLSRDIPLSPGATALSSKWVFAHEGNRYVLHQVTVEGDNHVHDLIHGTEIAELPRTLK
jgi:hypothetical protein